MTACCRLLLSVWLVSLAGGTLPAAELTTSQRWSGFPDWVMSVAFAPDGHLLAAGSYDIVKLWDVDAGEEVETLKIGAGFVRSLAFNADGTRMAVGTYQRAEIWDVKSRMLLRQLTGIRGYTTGVAFLGDDVLTSSEDGVVRRWNGSDGSLIQAFEAVEQPIQGLAISPDGTMLAAACGDETRLSQKGMVLVWGLADGLIVHRFVDHERPVLCVDFVEDGRKLLSGSIDEHVNIYDLQAGKGLGFYGGHSRPVTGVQQIPGSPHAASGCGGRFKGKNELHIWEIEDGTKIALAEDAHAERITGLSVAPGGLIALSSQDKTVSIWKFTTEPKPEAKPAAEQQAPAKADKPLVEEPKATETTSVLWPPVAGALGQVAVETEAPVKRVGIIGLDTSHSIAFTKSFNAEKPRPELAGFRVVAAYPYGSRDIESSSSRIPNYIEQVEKMGVEVVDSIEELLKRVDFVLLETNDGRPHLEQVKQVLAAGKPVFVDKPVAGSLQDCLAIFDLAEKAKVPLFSSSSLRFMTGAQTARSGEWGNVTGCDAFSPCSLEATHPDLFWYGIHGVEILFTVMGPDVKTVTRISQEGTDLAVGVWVDGRVGTFRGIRSGKGGYGGNVFTDKGTYKLEGFQGYDPLLVSIAEFFRTGKPPVSAEETIALYAFMEAADESKRQGGVPVSIADVLEKSRAAAGVK